MIQPHGAYDRAVLMHVLPTFITVVISCMHFACCGGRFDGNMVADCPAACPTYNLRVREPLSS